MAVLLVIALGWAVVAATVGSDDEPSAPSAADTGASPAPLPTKPPATPPQHSPRVPSTERSSTPPVTPGADATTASPRAQPEEGRTRRPRERNGDRSQPADRCPQLPPDKQRLAPIAVDMPAAGIRAVAGANLRLLNQIVIQAPPTVNEARSNLLEYYRRALRLAAGAGPLPDSAKDEIGRLARRLHTPFAAAVLSFVDRRC